MIEFIISNSLSSKLIEFCLSFGIMVTAKTTKWVSFYPLVIIFMTRASRMLIRFMLLSSETILYLFLANFVNKPSAPSTT
jgi:hypothetical protein